MTRTVDLVIVGGSDAALAATIDAVNQGLRVLVVLRQKRRGLGRAFRQAVAAAIALTPQQLTVLTGAEIACVDGVTSVEAVVIRQLETNRLIGFNASALLTPGEPVRLA